MYSKICSATLRGISAETVSVETDIAFGFPALSIVGLPDASIRESRERVRTAIQNSGFVFPDRRVTVNLSPADVRKEGSHLDLPIAIGILAASGIIQQPDSRRIAFLGELTLDGGITRIKGALPLILGLKEDGFDTILVPASNRGEAQLVKGPSVYAVSSLREAVGYLTGSAIPDRVCPNLSQREQSGSCPDFEDVAGQQVVSYRAPAFSITHENPWAVEVLAACGIKNDASIFPTFRAYGGYQHFPQDRPCTIGYHGATLREFPISLATVFGKRIAYSGGGYFRLLPYWFVSRMLDRSNYNICYFHLVDLVSGKIKLKSRKEYEDYFHEPGTLKNRLVRFAKANATMGDSYHKLVKLLSTHSFVSMAEAVRQTDWSKTSTIEL